LIEPGQLKPLQRLLIIIAIIYTSISDNNTSGNNDDKTNADGDGNADVANSVKYGIK